MKDLQLEVCSVGGPLVNGPGFLSSIKNNSLGGGFGGWHLLGLLTLSRIQRQYLYFPQSSNTHR